MISKDFSEFPDHRNSFFELLKAIILHCFPVMFSLESNYLELIINSIIWAFKHNQSPIAILGLETAVILFQGYEQCDLSLSESFFSRYYTRFLNELLFVLTDLEHKNGFKLQCTVLSNMLAIAEKKNIKFSKDEDSVQFLRKHLFNLLSQAFPHLQRPQIETFVIGLFDLNKDIDNFKAHVRDFLINLRELPEDDPELFAEELELEHQRKLESMTKIPGMLSQLEDEQSE